MGRVLVRDKAHCLVSDTVVEGLVGRRYLWLGSDGAQQRKILMPYNRIDSSQFHHFKNDSLNEEPDKVGLEPRS